MKSAPMTRTTSLLLPLLVILFFQRCESPEPEIKDDPNLRKAEYYILCEGSFTQANASFWSVDETLDTVRGPLFWDTEVNPLGDVGQSMALNGHTLYLIMNNSHEIRVLDLENGLDHIADIDVASPRYMAIQASQNRGFVSSWNLGALLVVDLLNNTVTDTVLLNGLPEEVLIKDDQLFVAMNMYRDWSANNQILELNISETLPSITRGYTVLDGPSSMVISDDMLFVTSIAYDTDWVAVTGTSRIDLLTGAVISASHGTYLNYSADMDILNGVPYRIFGKSIVPLNEDLSLDLAGSIANLEGIYSFSIQNEKLVIGTSDYSAPDPVYFYSASGDSLGSIDVAGYPGDVIFYEPL
ncbi:MAG: hypothetical protein K9N35_00510 [Candidatus Marinimicrobia bacterium]|nr:hypothetical protein [Candidatus Neomarinimicrobiota bacterium]